jgi:hypothetical protein
MIRAKIPMSYGGKHAAYHRMVDGKKSSYTMPLHPGTLIDAVRHMTLVFLLLSLLD